MADFKVINPEVSLYSEDECPSFAQANEGLDYETVNGSGTVIVFDWNAALGKPRLDKVDWDYMKKLAQDWPTCACGNQCVVVPRFSGGAPLDDELRTLGEQFNRAIASENKYIARTIMGLIEKRSTELLVQIYDTGGVSTK